MTTMRSWVGTILFISSCSLFVLLGFVNQSKILSANKCKMTYSHPHFEKVKMDSKVKEYQLYIHGSVEMLNPTPVLFIPGNSGSAKQVRSFASSTHNADEKFQYFALHFDKAMSATHGSVALKQAVFVNDALAAILALYERQDRPGGGDVEVILLAHSAGGLVARTALLLSNHPHHSVSSLVMLGSPNTRPTYTPDVSLDILYKRVNLAWRRSMYNTSSACQAASLLAHGVQHGDVPSDYTLADTSTNNDTIADHSTGLAVTASWDCSVNVPRTRVVSISGGEIDMEVPTPLTSLMGLAPRPQNTSMEQPEPQKLSTFLKPKGGYVRWFFVNIFALPRYVTGLADRLFQWTMGPKAATVSHATSNSSDTAVDGAEEQAASSNSSASAPDVIRRMEDISQDHWNTHIKPYLEPQHVSVRTTQLAGVGFPVDHKALLWCHQVVQTTTRLMARLAAAPSDVTLSGAELTTQIVKMKSSYTLPTWPAAADVGTGSCAQDVEDESGASAATCEGGVDVIPIAPVQEELRRDAAKQFFMRVALDDERQYMLDLLTGARADIPDQRSMWGNVFGSLHVLSLALVTAHLTTVLTCYVAISLFVMATFVLYYTSAKSKWSVTTITHLYLTRDLVSEMTLLLPENHLFLNSFADINMAILPSFLSSHFVVAGGQGTKNMSSAAIVVFLAAALIHVIRSSQSPIEFVRYNGLFVQWVVSYGAALALQLCVLVTLYAIRFMINTIYSVLKTVLRATIWCKPVRHFLRPRLRPVHKFYDLVPAVEWVVLVLLLSTMIVGTVIFGQQSTRLLDQASVSATMAVPYAGRVVQVASLLFLLSFSLFLLVLGTAIVWPREGSSRLLTPAIALCLPGVFLGMPSFKFCAEVFSLSLDSYMTISSISSLLDAFGPDLINYALGALAMAMNLLYLQRYESKILPVAFLYEIFDAAKRVRTGTAASGSGGTSFLSAFTGGGGNSACMHEDGGVAAIFEENDKDVQSFCKGSVLLGPALRVVTCDCSQNKSLRSFGEWCEWCRCAHCGGKTISHSARAKAGGAYADSESFFDSAARTSLGMRDITSDLLVLGALLVAAGYALMNAAAEPFRLFLVIGGVSAAMCFARVCRYGGY